MGLRGVNGTYRFVCVCVCLSHFAQPKPVVVESRLMARWKAIRLNRCPLSRMKYGTVTLSTGIGTCLVLSGGEVPEGVELLKNRLNTDCRGHR